MNLPAAFEEKMRALLGDEFDEYIACYEEPRYYGMRVNTGKISVEEFEKTLTDDDREYLSDNVVARKTVKIVTDSVVLVKGEPAEKKPAKKAAKKAEPRE